MQKRKDRSREGGRKEGGSVRKITVFQVNLAAQAETQSGEMPWCKKTTCVGG